MKKKLLNILTEVIIESKFQYDLGITPKNTDQVLPIASQDLSSGSYLDSEMKVRRNVVGYTISRANELVKIAEKYLGVPYVFGGKTPSGFDCSGYVKYVMDEFGYKLLPHGARNQKSQSTSVTESELREGDLVFFDTARLGSAVDHLGMIISGPESSKIRMIHASSGSGVTIIEDLKANSFYSSILDSYGRYPIYESGTI